MADWKRCALGDLPLHQASTMSWLPGVRQGFTTRQGGVSGPPYDTLNLGLHVGDDSAQVQINRQRLWTELGVPAGHVVMAEQVHGCDVAVVECGADFPVPGADALVTNTPDILLMLLFADCVPIYFLDPVSRVIGLAHSGWRGTVGNIAGETMRVMRRDFGSQPRTCLAAIGPCIGGESYEVGREVADEFRRMTSLRAGTAVYPKNEFTGRYTLDLRQVIYAQLLDAGLRADYIAVSDEDTLRSRREFFSYRRDGAKSGRMAAFLGLRPLRTIL